jgi:hypothetical protein
MEMQELEITIDKEGRVQVAVRGVKGEGCMELTRELENAIGVVEERTPAAEYYEQPEAVTQYQHQSRQ